MTLVANRRVANAASPMNAELGARLSALAASPTRDLSTTNYIEVSFEAMQIFERAAQLVAAHGGLQLLIDYGNVRVDYPSLRYIENHRIAERVDSAFLKRTLGNVDLSVDVHFAPLMALASKLALAPLLSSQAAFLRRCAIEPLVVRKLTKCATDADAARVIGEFRRLTDDAEMGRIYKVLEFCHRK